ncbi:hypothetical protein M0D21_01045 [Aquimarina sp. D1M17]|uniref:hypothetical protein n=1 Tax=Aquimarina acroporae TaxID=2937283 RepID=UPI0020BD4966|nr:hypothetical protein [Aquimarina acroporae]MCK8520137.1 hypothetical protein [Aquimarina acroporae]
MNFTFHGFDSLIITRDWINFGVNVGYYEGVIVSGLQAGQVVRNILGLPSGTKIFSGVQLMQSVFKSYKNKRVDTLNQRVFVLENLYIVYLIQKMSLRYLDYTRS